MKENHGNASSESDVASMICDEALQEVKHYNLQEPVLVADDEGDEPIELPTESDNTLLLSTLAGQYPGTSGLRYRNLETNAMRGIRLTDGKLHPPENGWGNCVYYCVFPKENKRKSNDDMGNSTAKTKRIDVKQTCCDLIVLGLPYKASEKQLKDYFETFGQVVRAKIKRDPRTGHSKGFGFIRFKNYECQEKVLSQDHKFEGSSCFVKLFDVKDGVLMDKESRKVFIGGCTEDMKGDDLRDYFSAFGAVTNVFIPKTFRAFAFVTFLDPEVAQSLCGEVHVIKGVTVHVSNAARKTNHGQHLGGGAGGQSVMKQNMQVPGPGRGPGLGPGQGMASQGAEGNAQNLVGLGAIPMNAALIAAALTQVGWNLAGSFQGNRNLISGIAASQTVSLSSGGLQKECDGQNKDGGNMMQALGWTGSQETDSAGSKGGSQQ